MQVDCFTEGGLEELNKHFAEKSYIDGYEDIYHPPHPTPSRWERERERESATAAVSSWECFAGVLICANS